VDGWIARNVKGQMSIFGSYIDPLADKVLVSVLTFSLTYVGVIPSKLTSGINRSKIMLDGKYWLHFRCLDVG